jgi:hypothetical protein
MGDRLTKWAADSQIPLPTALYAYLCPKCHKRWRQERFFDPESCLYCGAVPALFVGREEANMAKPGDNAANSSTPGSSGVAEPCAGS